MGKKRVQKLAAAGMIIVLLVSQAGCAGKDSGQEEGNPEDMVYAAQGMNTTGARGSISSFHMAGDRIYFTTYRWDAASGEEGVSEEGLYVMDMDGGSVREISLPEMAEGTGLQSMASDGEGTLYFLLDRYDERSGENRYVLLETDEQGTETARRDITEEFEKEESSSPRKLLANAEGEVAVVTGNAFCLYDRQLERTAEVTVDTGIDAAAVAENGQFLCGSSDDKGAYVKALDSGKGKWGRKYEVDIKVFDSMDSLMDGKDGWDFYYGNNSGIYGYSMSAGVSVKIMDYVLSDVTADDILNIAPAGGERLVCLMLDGESSTGLVKYEKKDPDSDKNKTVVTIGAVCMETDVTNAVVEFNRCNEKYRVEIVDYGAEEGRMNADIAAGKQPDIICFDDSMPMEEYMEKGLFEDLTPYYDRDGELGTEDILPSIYEAMKVDGKLYSVSPRFTIMTVIGSRRDLGNRTGWTYEEMKELLREKGTETRPFFVQNKSEMLDIFLAAQTGDFIDWENGTCRFDSREFKDILEICNTAGIDGNTDYSADNPGVANLVSEGKLLFLDGLLHMEDLPLYREMYQDEIAAVGYPCEDRNGSYFVLKDQLGIYSGSEVKEGAWEFLRTFMTKQYQGTKGETYYPPTRKDCYAMWLQKMTATEPYVDELGQDVQPFEVYASIGELGVSIKGIPQKDAELYKELVENTTEVYSCDAAVKKIISEEAKVYFSGQKNVEDTAEIIQERVSLYVNERR